MGKRINGSANRKQKRSALSKLSKLNQNEVNVIVQGTMRNIITMPFYKRVWFAVKVVFGVSLTKKK